VRRALFIVGLGTLLSGAVVSSHHSFSAVYFEDQTVSVAGTVEVFEYRNPHAWVRILAPEGGGQTQKVAAEWGSPNRLRRQGIGVDTIRPGDHVVITGSPSRNAAVRDIHLKQIERPADGWSWVGRGERR
jgi:hypothetical protein